MVVREKTFAFLDPLSVGLHEDFRDRVFEYIERVLLDHGRDDFVTGPDKLGEQVSANKLLGFIFVVRHQAEVEDLVLQCLKIDDVR